MKFPLYALVAELVDALDLGSSVERRGGSSPSKSTMINKEKWDKLRAGHTAKPKEPIHLFYISKGDGNGDLLYNTCREIIDRDDTDYWSHQALEEVFVWLEKGMRWPDYMVEYIPVATGEGDRQYDMTQDPWILAYCCAVHLERYDLIEKYKPSIKIFNLPDKWAWRRSLLGKWNMYWLWRLITPHNWMQGFVYVFYGYMDQAYLLNIYGK